jgi:ABC-2 type transport system permease protein
MLSAALTFGLYVAGHFSGDLRNFQQVVHSQTAARFARGVYWVLPNLAQFDVKNEVVHGVHVPLGYMAMTTAYAGIYIAMLLTISVLVFSRRDFK